MKNKARRNLAESLRQAMAINQLSQAKDKYGNNWGTGTWPMNDAYCSYTNCDFEQTIAIALAGQKCPHCRKPLSWAGKWKVDKEIELEDGRKRIIQVEEYREPLGKWKTGYAGTSKKDTEKGNQGDGKPEQVFPGGYKLRDPDGDRDPGGAKALDQPDGIQE